MKDLILAAGYILLVVLLAWGAARLRKRRVATLLSEADADLAKRYGPEWRQLAWAGHTPRPRMPNFDAVRDKPIGDLSPAQQADARELWIREQKEWFASYYRGHIEFLLRRLDEARGMRR